MTIWKIPWPNVSNNYCSHLCLFDFMWLLTVSHASPMFWMSNLSSKSKTEGCLSRPLEMHISQALSAFIFTMWNEAKDKKKQKHKLCCFVWLLARMFYVIELVGLKESDWFIPNGWQICINFTQECSVKECS